MVMVLACAWVSEDDVQGLIDRDGDGIAAPAYEGDDCDDDDPDIAGPSTGYRDDDGDGFGGDEQIEGCAVSTDSTDCDDADAAIHPGAAESCDAAGIDEDCDGIAAGCFLTDGGFVVEGRESASAFGWSVATLADFDDDGMDEIVIGAPTAAGVEAEIFVDDPEKGSGACGEVYLLSPPAPGADGYAETRIAISSRGRWTALGNEATGRTGDDLLVTDMTGDGLPDVLVTAPLANVDTSIESGAAYLFSAERFDFRGSDEVNSATITFAQEEYGQYASDAAHPVGVDIVGADLVLGWPGHGDGQGAMEIYNLPVLGDWGADDANWPVARIDGPSDASVRAGETVATLDLTGDGFLDYVLGAPTARDGTGAVYVFAGPISYGGGAVYTVDDGFRVDGLVSGDAFGAALFVSDFDADGVNDLAVTATGAHDSAGAISLLGSGIQWTDSGGITDAGAAFATLVGAEAGGEAGTSLVRLDESLVIGMPVRAGGVLLVSAPWSGTLELRDAATLLAGPENSAAGVSLATGDIDADGILDLIAGMPDEAGVGAVAVVPGASLP